MANKINYTGSSKVIKRICESLNDIIDNYAPTGIVMWKVLFYDSTGETLLQREYVANGDDCIYGTSDSWTDSIGGNIVQDATKNISQNTTLYEYSP